MSMFLKILAENLSRLSVTYLMEGFGWVPGNLKKTPVNGNGFEAHAVEMASEAREDPRKDLLFFQFV